MMYGYFFDTTTNIIGNNKLREPQVEAYIKIREYFSDNPKGEALVVLPTGTGKSGLISIAPFEVSNKRVLVITPGLVTKKSVVKTLHPLEDNFWVNYDIILDPAAMPVVEEYEPDMLQSSLEKCHFVIANVHKLYDNNPNSLLKRVDSDFFDMVIVDEAHHSVAQTWQNALQYFKNAKILHVTGTPYRGDKKDIPGEEIHNTPLAEVMALRYVKWLRKTTVNNPNLFFTVAGNDKKYTLNEILDIKDKEWVERSVALSSECSEDVIIESIQQLDHLRESSPGVPHKVLAVACSIAHAEDLATWYHRHDLRVVILHSNMSNYQLEENFLRIEENRCDVVVSVNMLMEGYDHKYLTVLAIFRPYRSLNAFAQVVGRILRAIPDEEITTFAIDNNAVVIYHEEIGLDLMWKFFSREVEKSKTIPVKEYRFSEREYVKRAIEYGTVETDEYFVSGQDSFLTELDFNKLFEEARETINTEIDEHSKKLRAAGLDEEEVETAIEALRKKTLKGKQKELDEILLSKRPELLRKQTRDYLRNNAEEAAAAILEEKGIDSKSSSLYSKFKNSIYNLRPDCPNDGILVRYINARLHKKYGPAKKREPETLLESKRYMDTIIDELRRMI